MFWRPGRQVAATRCLRVSETLYAERDAGSHRPPSSALIAKSIRPVPNGCKVMPNLGQSMTHLRGALGTALIVGMLTAHAVAASLNVSRRTSLDPGRVAGTIVRTRDGTLQGIVGDGVQAFLGVPFAAPPVGALRWRVPQPVKPWKGIWLATHYRPACIQNGMYPPDAAPEATSEDCLYLNIWKPSAVRSGVLPVMIWIYGGGLENGSAAVPLYAGDQLARNGIVVVTINYRLGVFGFLALQALTRESAVHSSGNYGLLDQIAALKWVKRNIAAFGGDPGNITVFGQSSGSISISALTTSPLAAGLFQRVIAESGGLFEPMELFSQLQLKGAEAQGARFMAAAHAQSLSALRHISAEKLVKLPFSAHIIIDGYVLPRAPWKTYAEGKANKVSLLLGWNADEGSVFLRHAHVTPQDYQKVLNQSFPRFLVQLLAPNPGRTDQSARRAAVTFNTDMRFRWDMWRWAIRAARHAGDRVYMYEFTRSPPYPESSFYHGLGPTHGTEMQYVFDHLVSHGVPWTRADLRLALVIPDYWTRFARKGNPNGSGLAPWPQFLPQHPMLMRLGTQIHAEPIAEVASLRRISLVYDAAIFIMAHWIGIIATISVMIAALVAATWLLIRRR
jgi:para-nitrobenzyl esterase